MLVTVNLVGKIGELFGYQWELAIRSPAEAIRAISSQIEGFTEFLNTSHHRGIGYQVLIDEQEIAEEMISYPAKQSITIIAIITGSGDASTRIIAGVALLAISFALPGIGLGFASTAIASFGISLIAGGITELLSPQNEKEESYLSDGSQVTRAYQGQPVPVLFGTRYISPVPISVWVDNENIRLDFVPT